jgi:hypothetical protein
MAILTETNLAVGARVRLAYRIGGCFPGAMYEIDPGPTGTVVALFDEAARRENGGVIAHICFDEPIEDLEEWQNRLHVWRGGKDDPEIGDAVLSDFELAGF